MTPAELLLYFGMPTSLGLLGLIGIWLHERSAPAFVNDRPDMSFEVDEHTAALITQLQSTFGVHTNAGMIRKALALAEIVRQHAAPDGTITFLLSDGKPIKVSLAG